MLGGDVGKQVQHRKSFQGLSSIKIFDDQIGKHFTPNELALYENLRAGALVTSDILSKFTQCGNKCPASQKADSMEHRLFECDLTQPLRKKFVGYLDTWKKLKKLPPYTRLFGLFQETTGLPKLSSMLQQLPFPNLELHSCDKFEVYMDGSCARPANRRLRLPGLLRLHVMKFPVVTELLPLDLCPGLTSAFSALRFVLVL